MSTSTADSELDVKAASVRVTDKLITVGLEDGRTISVPTSWYPRLLYATQKERENFEVWEDGIEWPDVEADFSIRGLLLGHRSGENPACFRFWLANRKRGRRVTVEEWLKRQSEIRSAKGKQEHGARRRSPAPNRKVKQAS